MGKRKKEFTSRDYQKMIDKINKRAAKDYLKALDDLKKK